MGNTKSVRDIIQQTLQQIQQSANNREMLVVFTISAGNQFSAIGESTIDGLIGLLYDTDEKIRILAMFYLGYLHQAKIMDVKRAIEPIRDSAAIRTTDMIYLTAGVALSWLDDSKGIEVKKAFMKNQGMQTDGEYNKGAMSTIIEYVAGVLH